MSIKSSVTVLCMAIVFPQNDSSVVMHYSNASSQQQGNVHITHIHIIKMMAAL